MTSPQPPSALPLEDLIHRLRSRAMIEAPQDNDGYDPESDADDSAEITWGELAEIAALLREAADALGALVPLPATPTEGVRLIAAERERQKAVEGWTPEHDDSHMDAEMNEAARCYLSAAFLAERGRRWNGAPPPMWPWNQSWWKPSDDPIRNLAKAGALIAAEIDRLQRQNGVAFLPVQDSPQPHTPTEPKDSLGRKHQDRADAMTNEEAAMWLDIIMLDGYRTSVHVAMRKVLKMLREPTVALPVVQDEAPKAAELETLRIEVETLRTLLAAWQKRAYEAERTHPHGEPVDPALMEPYYREMREKTIPAIVAAVRARQRAAAEAPIRILGASRPSPADDEIAVGQVWSAPDGRQLRVAGLSESEARIPMRNVESNRLTYMDRRNFDASQKWHLTRVGPSPADRQEEK